MVVDMYRSIANPCIYDLLDLFRRLNIRGPSKIIFLTILGRNGLNIGLCSDGILQKNSTYSKDTIQKSCQELARKNLFAYWCNNSTRQRFGSIVVSNTYFDKYWCEFYSEDQESSRKRKIHKGEIVSYSIDNSYAVMIKESDDRLSQVISRDFERSMVTIPLGSKIEFSATTVNSNKISAIHIKPIIKNLYLNKEVIV